MLIIDLLYVSFVASGCGAIAQAAYIRENLEFACDGLGKDTSGKYKTGNA